MKYKDIKENKEVSFAVQPNRVRIAKDTSLGAAGGIRTLVRLLSN